MKKKHAHCPRVGISSCLLGKRVRYDGDHQKQPWLVDILGKQVEWVPICPEMEMGLGVPRETIRLISRGKTIRLRTSLTKKFLTTRALAIFRKLAGELPPLDAFILKSGSPSCGPSGVKVYTTEEDFVRNGTGLFCHILKKKAPHLLIVDENDLMTEKGRNHFLAALGVRICRK